MTRYITPEPLDPRERFGLYRLCDCSTCEGKGKVLGPAGALAKAWGYRDAWKDSIRCLDCRGEGRVRQEVASCETPEAVGVALVTLAREGEWEECQFGLLDREGETGKRWLVLPWPATARTATAAGKLLRSRRG